MEIRKKKWKKERKTVGKGNYLRIAKGKWLGLQTEGETRVAGQGFM